MANIPQIVSGATIVVGLLLLVGSSLFLAQIKPLYDLISPGCPYVVGGTAAKEFCNAGKAGLAAGSIGILASVLQVVFGIYAVMKLKTQVNQIWQGIHALLCVLSIVCFAIGIHFEEWYKAKYDKPTGLLLLSEDTPRFFYAMTMIDAIFCVVAIVLSFTMFKNNKS